MKQKCHFSTGFDDQLVKSVVSVRDLTTSIVKSAVSVRYLATSIEKIELKFFSQKIAFFDKCCFSTAFGDHFI